MSGNPYSPFLGYQDGRGEVYDDWAGRLPLHWTIDMRADRSWRRKWGEVVFFIDVQNATNRDNIEGREVDGDMEVDVPGLPILPLIGVEILPRP